MWQTSIVVIEAPAERVATDSLDDFGGGVDNTKFNGAALCLNHCVILPHIFQILQRVPLFV